MTEKPEYSGKRFQASLFVEIGQQSPDGLLVQALDGKILLVNPAAGRLFGLKPEELIGRLITEFMTPDRAEAWAHDLNKLRAGDWRHIDSVIEASDGRRVPVRVHGFDLSPIAGISAMALHISDHTVSLRLERALLASRDEWEQCFDAISESICMVDRQWKIVRANQAMQTQFGPRVKDLIGQDVRALLGLEGDGNVNGGKVFAGQDAPFSLYDLTLPSLPGGRFSISSYPLVEHGGRRRGAIVIIRNVTEQARLREELRQNQMRIQQDSKIAALGRLAGGVAHDFNNLLTSVMGCGTVIMQSLADSDPLRNPAKEIIAAGERGAQLIRQLMDFSLDTPVKMIEADINGILKDLEAFLLRVLGADIALAMRLAPDLHTVRLDPCRAEQVIMNLAINARDAMPGGGKLEIETRNVVLDDFFCRTHSTLKPGEHILLSISDSGIGMTPEVREHMFEPFFTTKEKGKGTGFGLAIVFGIVKQFGGIITCYSEVGTGTTFKVYLPAARQRPPPETPGPAADSTPAGTGAETLLVIDDEQNIVTLIRHLLSGKGYSVLATHSAKEAIELAGSHPGMIHLAIIDLSMPEMGGKELLARLRKGRPDIKALFMSGYGAESAVQNGLMDAGSRFIQKPFTVDGLARSIRETLDA